MAIIKETKKTTNTGKIRNTKINYFALLGVIGTLGVTYVASSNILENKQKEESNLETVYYNEETILLEEIAVKLEATETNAENLKQEILKTIESYRTTHEYIPQEIKEMFNEMEAKLKIATIYNKSIEEIKADILTSVAKAMYRNDCKENLEENSRGL